MTRLLRTPALWWSLTAVWFCILWTFSSFPKLPPGPEIPFQDKIIHTLYYSGAAFCVWLALRLKNPPATASRAMLWAVVFCMTVGALDEFHQSFVPGRSGNDPGDWLADSLGGFLGSWAAGLLGRGLVGKA